MTPEIKLEPHIVGMPKPSNRKKRERKVRVYSPEQMYAHAPLVIQIWERLQRMNEGEVLAAVSPRLSTIPNWQERLAHQIQKIQQKEEEKKLKVKRDAEEAERKRNNQPFKIVEDCRDAWDGGYTEEIQPYLKMSIPELQRLLLQLKDYNPPRLHEKIKPQVYSWLKSLILEKQAKAEAVPEKRSFLGKLRGH